MAYITQTDVEAAIGSIELIKLTDDDGDGSPDTGVVDWLLDAASGDIDSYLGKRIQTPIGSPPNSVKSLTMVRFHFLAYKRRGFIPDAISNDWKEAERKLEMIGKGEIDIGLPQTTDGALPTWFETGADSSTYVDNSLNFTDPSGPNFRTYP